MSSSRILPRNNNNFAIQGYTPILLFSLLIYQAPGHNAICIYSPRSKVNLTYNHHAKEALVAIYCNCYLYSIEEEETNEKRREGKDSIH